MASNEFAPFVGGTGERSVNGALACLLRLTGDAVMTFDGSGRILFANEQAERLFAHPRGHAGDLTGADIRLLFPPAVGVAPAAPFTAASLPFPLDGNASVIVCADGSGAAVEVRVRCDRIQAPGETYLLVARPNDAVAAARGERDRLVDELSRANKRLSGTLDIVLGTIDSGDVGTLFSRALTEITKTVDTDGSVMYLSERDGFHLRGTSDGMPTDRLARFIPYGRAIEALATREGHALRMRVLPPEPEELRRGRLTSRRVVDEETHRVHRVPTGSLPPFASFLAVPVWFGGHVIALIETGWRGVHPMRRDDGRLLDAVAQYLSVQLMGAFSAMRAQKRDQLAALSSRLREKVMAADRIDGTLLDQTMAQAAGELDARLLRLIPTDGGLELRLIGPALGVGKEGAEGVVPAAEGVASAQGATPAPAVTSAVMPAEVLDDALPENLRARPGACSLEKLPELCSWLNAHGYGSTGMLVDLGVVGGERYRVLMLRSADPGSFGDPEPPSEMELGFLSEFASDMAELVTGGEAHAQDKRIAQALQSGMRNELQEVPGITSQGLYSSATAQAFVGGDFYDLIRLPGRRACVIMGDVSGKGVEAASVSAAVRTALGAYAWEGLRPARMVRSLNDFLLGFSRLETFATLFVGIIDLTAASLTYCSAGHPPALLLRAVSGEITLLDVQSGVVGAFKDMLYQDGEASLQKGDMLLLYTDGTTEARAPSGAFFGEDGLRDAVMREWSRGFDGIADRLLATLDRFTQNNLDDDVAIVALRFDDVERA